MVSKFFTNFIFNVFVLAKVSIKNGSIFLTSKRLQIEHQNSTKVVISKMTTFKCVNFFNYWFI